MSDFIRRKEIFPFMCQNSECGQKYDEEAFMKVINRWGMVYADCGETVHQGITCPECKKTLILSFPRNNPLVDLRDFIISPNFNNPMMNSLEQVFERDRAKTERDLLKFKCIPAWDEETVKFDEIKEYVSDWTKHIEGTGLSYLLSPSQLIEALNKENETGRIHLRRFYPDIPEFRNLLTCISPDKITYVEPEVGLVEAKGDTPKEIKERNEAWLWLLEDASGKSFAETVRKHLRVNGINDATEEEIHTYCQKHLFDLRYEPVDKIRSISRSIDFEDKILEYLNKLFSDILYKVYFNFDLVKKRKRLDIWVDKVEPGKALFVDAPLGLGKTHSIVNTLVKNSDKSAIIFLPTKRLCEKVVHELKTGIAIASSINPWEKKEQYFEAITDKNRNKIYDQYRSPELKYKREFLQKEIYYYDGINKEECPHFDEIVERYQRKHLKKRDICFKCMKGSRCRFIKHRVRAPLSRIIVATHYQYDVFYRQTSIRKWFKDGYEKKEEAVARSFYLIDEDLILSNCFQPLSLDYEEVNAFSATITNFLNGVDGFQDADLAISKIQRLIGQISQCDKTAVIPPIDEKFKIPYKVKKAWKETFTNLQLYVPDFIELKSSVGDYLQAFENAIRLGMVVQKYKTHHRQTDKDDSEKLYRGFFPNTKTYNLSILPPHVFFDGTKIDDELLKKKLRKIEFKTLDIKLNSPWRLRLWQNTNTDLPKRWIFRDEEKVKWFVRDLINDLGYTRKYLFLTTKSIRKTYLEKFLTQEYPHLDYVLEHYGNLKGLNHAQFCDVCVMLGSFVPSDAVEIAMALEFIQDKLPKSVPIPTYGEKYLWTWKGSKGKRTYRNEYSVVEKMAKTLRYSEHRQALGRTRYLYHDVDFYVISKDPVSDYEPFLPKPEIDQYKDGIFRPRNSRSDSEYEKVKITVFDWLKTHKTATITEISNASGVGRHTVSKHLKKMLEEGLLVLEGKTKYKLPIGDLIAIKNGQDNLLDTNKISCPS